jgi:two-component system, chemotaxis family, sensor kinase CheA
MATNDHEQLQGDIESSAMTLETEKADPKGSVRESDADSAENTRKMVTLHEPADRDETSSSIEEGCEDTSIRVQISLLDSLMTLAGELVLSRNQLLQTIGSEGCRNAEAVGQRIDLITSELQGAIMLTRMQPVGNVFGKFPRLVRDLAGQSGKKVEVAVIGKDVELDKTIIEAISDPLMRLVRNAVEHGLELPDERGKLGKGECGRIVLSASHEAGQVTISIKDDGQGIDGDRLAADAVKKGLISADQAQSMSEGEKINLILLPELSMVTERNAVSGRGFGMDMVKTNLDKLGGSIDILSVKGQGTTISITLPLSLAIIPCQFIKTGEERYAIPQANLDELLRVPAHQVKERIERVGDAEVVRLRGNLLPLVRLADLLGVERTYLDGTDGTRKADRRIQIADRRSKVHRLSGDERAADRQKEDASLRSDSDRRTSITGALNIVVVSTGEVKYGLIVDQLQDSEEIVIKPLGAYFQDCKGYAGATIMGDGKVALILDVSNLAKMAQLTRAGSSYQDVERVLAAEEEERDGNNRQSLLIFHSAENERFAVPLSQVERIEKIGRSQIEELGGMRVMQYREGSLSLFRIDDVARVQPLADREELLVIVFRFGGRMAGLLATGPIDAIETSLTLDEITLKQPGIRGSAIINRHTTMLVDMADIVGHLFPDFPDVSDGDA